jgi:hypothetical protein
MLGRRSASLGLALALHLAHLQRARGEDHLDYRFEDYQEDGGRIHVETHSGLFELKAAPWLNLKGEMVYDAISGASPTGAPPPAQIQFVSPALGGPNGPSIYNTSVPLATMHDQRYAGSMEAAMTFGPHHFTPQFSYSEESDYISYGAAMGYSLDLNQKNTTLNFGWSHNWDTVLPKGFLATQERKDVDDFLIGVNQLLGPKTVLAVNGTYGSARGYLDDQYKGVLVETTPQLDPTRPALIAENRPSHRDRYIAYAALTQYITPLHASVEGAYRFFHDSYDISAHTASLTWFQKLGRHVLVAPTFRYYRQSAASFYVTELPDYPNNPTSLIDVPQYYSADYRLSELESFAYGVSISVKPTHWLSFDAAYQRYEMFGLDHVTSPTAYPKANVFTIGARLWF